MPLDDLYQEIILDHYKKPRHPGRLEDAQVEVHHYNPVCGDELTVGLRLDGDRVAAVAVDGKGCSISHGSIHANDIINVLANCLRLYFGITSIENYTIYTFLGKQFKHTS